MKKKGFTLIEIMITIVIVGVMSTVALPLISGQIESVRASEAFQIMGSLKKSVENCLTMASGNIAECSSIASLNVEVPSQAAGAFFDYTVEESAGTIVISATKEIDRKKNTIAMTLASNADGSLDASLSTAPANSPYNQLVQKVMSNMNGSAVGAGTRSPLGP
jgi:prepilin-type N-terminal cleavage/methylation domain-containing protein